MIINDDVDMKGYQLITAVKADTQLQGIPILLMAPGDEDKISRLQEGADDYLIKVLLL